MGIPFIPLPESVSSAWPIIQDLHVAIGVGLSLIPVFVALMYLIFISPFRQYNPKHKKNFPYGRILLAVAVASVILGAYLLPIAGLIIACAAIFQATKPKQ